MKQVNKRRGLIYYLSFLLILVVISFSYYPTRVLPLMRGGATPYYLGIFLSILCVPVFFKSKSAFYAILYIVVVFLNHFMGNKALPTIGATLTEAINVLLPAVVFYLISTRKGDVFNPLLLYSFLIIVAVMTYESYKIDNAMPGIIRSLVHWEDEEEATNLLLMGLAPYQLPHALPVLIPPCIMIIKKPNNLFKRMVGILFLFCIIILVMLSQSFGAFAITLFALLVSLLVREGDVRKNFRKLMISTIVILILSSDTVQLAVVDFFKNFFDSDSKMYTKLDDLAVGIVTDTFSEVSGNRGSLLGQTLQAIFRNPIFGVNDRSYGNHNALLDRWACFGLVGFIPLILFIYNMIKVTFLQIPSKLRTYYLIGVITSLVMMSTKNMMGWYQWVCFVLILPLMFYVWRDKDFDIVKGS